MRQKNPDNVGCRDIKFIDSYMHSFLVTSKFKSGHVYSRLSKRVHF